MEEKSLHQKKKLITEFMGITPRMFGPDSYGWSDTPYFVCYRSTPEDAMKDIVEYVKYDSDWNWLMKAIKKANDLCEDLADTEEAEALRQGFLAQDIDATFNALVEVVEAYNNNSFNQADIESSISAEDVLQVASDLDLALTKEQVDAVIELYPSEQENDPTGNWCFVVEHCINQVLDEDEK